MIYVRLLLWLPVGSLFIASLFAQSQPDVTPVHNRPFPSAHAVSLLSATVTIHEDFSGDPMARGWGVFGEPSLFEWNAAAARLAVTWDSSKSNSYLYRPLGTVLGVEDDFGLEFSLELLAMSVGPDPLKPYAFPLGIGLMNWEHATDPEFFRGAGIDPDHGPRNLLEFAYFPDSGFGATIAPTVVSSQNEFATSFNFPLELALGDRFDVVMRYVAAERTLRTVVTRNHAAFDSIQDVVLPAGFSGFRLDTVAISSYSDQGQDPDWGGSILAQGRIDHLEIELPGPPVHRIETTRVGDAWHTQFNGRAGWRYTLERTVGFQRWEPVDTHANDRHEPVVLVDPDPPSGAAFYRVRAERQ